MKNTVAKCKIYSLLKVQERNNYICPAGAKGLAPELKLLPGITELQLYSTDSSSRQEEKSFFL